MPLGKSNPARPPPPTPPLIDSRRTPPVWDQSVGSGLYPQRPSFSSPRPAVSVAVHLAVTLRSHQLKPPPALPYPHSQDPKEKK